MTTTIEAMKQAHAVLQSGALLCEVTAASILREALAAEEAQGAGPVAWRTEAAKWIRRKADEQETINKQYPRYVDSYPSWAGKVRDLNCLANDLEAEQQSPPFGLDTDPQPPGHIVDATELVGERAALIKRLRNFTYDIPAANSLMQVAADMLAAGAQQSTQLTEAVDANARLLVRMEGLKRAQQVAVPQSIHVTEEMHCAAVKVLHRAHGLDGLPQRMMDAMLAAAPQPPKAAALAADHAEDVRAMVPMTDQELDDLLPTNDSMSRADSLRWMARATERHHKIGVNQ